MLFIKITDFIQKLFSVNGGSGTAGKDLLLFFKGVNVSALSSCVSPAKSTVIISRIVELVPVIKLDHFPTAGKSLFMPPDRADHFLQEIFFRLNIIV